MSKLFGMPTIWLPGIGFKDSICKCNGVCSGPRQHGLRGPIDVHIIVVRGPKLTSIQNLLGKDNVWKHGWSIWAWSKFEGDVVNWLAKRKKPKQTQAEFPS